MNCPLSIAGLHQFDHVMHMLEWIWAQSDKVGSAANKNLGRSKICCDVNGDDGREMDTGWRKIPEAAVPGKENLSPKFI